MCPHDNKDRHTSSSEVLAFLRDDPERKQINRAAPETPFERSNRILRRRLLFLTVVGFIRASGAGFYSEYINAKCREDSRLSLLAVVEPQVLAPAIKGCS